MSFLTSIGTAVPKNKFDQATIARFMERLIDDEVQRRKMQAVFRASAIRTRYSVIDDYGKEGGFTFYSNGKNLEPVPTTAQRMQTYHANACALSLKAIENCITREIVGAITHLITVSCTGMYAPGLDIDLVKSLSLSSSVDRICINFMGCYAAINALKVADAICKANQNAKVLIVCTELCSLHFQKDFSEDNILANALFADGAAAMLVESEPNGKINLTIDSFHSDLLATDEKNMSWSIGDLGFEMRLSSYVPQILEKGIRQLLGRLSQKNNVTLDDFDHFAIHPGGKKILEVIGKELVLAPEKIKESFHVLENYGNMSSPSVVFVLNEILKQATAKNNGESVVAMAFGPGLTLESALLKIQL